MTAFAKFSFILWVTTLLMACGESAGDSAAQQGPQAIPVDVAQVIAEPITDWDSFTGRLQAPKSVALRPRVSGYIDFVAFEEGQMVKQGDTLFLIDNRQFKAEVERLRAQLNEAKSRHSLAERDLARAETLRKSQSVSQEVLDNRQSAVEQASAAVTAVQASLDIATLNRGFARVEAPISGRVSRADVTEGNYISAGQTVLTTIVSTDELYAYFDIDEHAYLQYQQTLGDDGILGQPVAMQLANETAHDHWGQIDFVDNQINPATGTLRLRAVFSNDNGKLLPGLFAHVKLAGSDTQEGILIDEKAIGTDLNNKYVLVVGKENAVEYRAVKLGDKMSGLRVITDGLHADDVVIVDGLQRVRPGAVVAPNKVPMASQNALDELQAWQQKVQQFNELAGRMPVSLSAGGQQ